MGRGTEETADGFARVLGRGRRGLGARARAALALRQIERDPDAEGVYLWVWDRLSALDLHHVVKQLEPDVHVPADDPVLLRLRPAVAEAVAQALEGRANCEIQSSPALPGSLVRALDRARERAAVYLRPPAPGTGQGTQIDLIRALRKATGWSLRDTKALSDRFYAGAAIELELDGASADALTQKANFLGFSYISQPRGEHGQPPLEVPRRKLVLLSLGATPDAAEAVCAGYKATGIPSWPPPLPRQIEFPIETYDRAVADLTANGAELLELPQPGPRLCGPGPQ